MKVNCLSILTKISSKVYPGYTQGKLAKMIKLCIPLFAWSGQRDSNSRPSGPKPDALPDCAMPRDK